MKYLTILVLSLIFYHQEKLKAEAPLRLSEIQQSDCPEQFAMGESKLQYIEHIQDQLYMIYTEPYEMKELSVRSLGLHFSTGHKSLKNWEFFFEQCGDEGWMENRPGIGASICPANGLKIGIRIKSVFLKTATGHKDFIVLPEIEGAYSMNPKTSFGLRLINPGGFCSPNTNNGLQTGFTAHAGIQYTRNTSCKMLTETSWQVNQPLTLRCGMEYRLFRKVTLRGGFHTLPATPTWGIGLLLKKATINWSSNLHQILGMSHSFSLSYAWQ